MVVLAFLPRASAAPAPPPGVVTAEAVLALYNGNPTYVVEQLHSAAVRDAIVRSEEAKGLRCLKGEKDPVGWLAARLKVEVDQKRRAAIIRVVRCPRKDALPLLRAVVEVYKARVCPENSMLEETQRRHHSILRALEKGNVLPEEVVKQSEAQLREIEANIKGLVLESPRLVPAERTR